MKEVVLYHGTDARMIEMSKEEREQYKKDCNLVIDSLYPLFKPLLQYEKVEVKGPGGQSIYTYEYPLKIRYEKLLNEKGGQNTYVNLLEKLMMIDCRNNNAGLYQYQDLYVCASKYDAAKYARRSFAGGESGLNAYRLIQGAEIIEFDNMYHNSDVRRAAEKIKDFAKEGNERPAIITIEGVDPQYLLHEDGKPLDQDDFEDWFEGHRKHRVKFRCTKKIELGKCKMELLNKDLFNKIVEEENIKYF